MKSKTAAMAQAAIALRKVIADVVLHNEAVASAVGMSHSEMQALHLLQLHGELTPGQLATRTGLTSGSVTGVLDRLEALGFAHRQPHPSDRRKVVIGLDEQRIWQVMGPHYAKHGEHLERVLQGFDLAQLAVVTDFLDRLVAAPD